MPKFLEKKLKKQYPNNPGAVYGTMNKLGFMHGSKETKKGKAAEKKHSMDMHGSSKSIMGTQKEKVSGGKKKKMSKRKAFTKNVMNAARY